MNIVYKTTNNINGKIYIGVHTTDNLDDGYLGSGKYLLRAIKKYGRENFSREILSEHDSIDDAYAEEARLVTINEVLNDNYYNLKVGGEGGTTLHPDIIERRNCAASLTISEQYENGRVPSNAGKTHSEETKKKISDSLKGRRTGEDNHMHGRSVSQFMSEEDDLIRRHRISESNKGKTRSDDAKKRYSESAKNRIWLVHRDGTITHTNDMNDPRLTDDEWQRGRKWKD